MAACFVESESFTDEVLRVADDEALARFEAELAANPEAGDLIPQSGGLRIAQMKLTRRNRNGTHHVIYLWLQKSRRAVLLLFMFYTNGKQAHVPPTLFAKLCAEVATIKAHYET